MILAIFAANMIPPILRGLSCDFGRKLFSLRVLVHPLVSSETLRGTDAHGDLAGRRSSFSHFLAFGSRVNRRDYTSQVTGGAISLTADRVSPDVLSFFVRPCDKGLRRAGCSPIRASDDERGPALGT